MERAHKINVSSEPSKKVFIKVVEGKHAEGKYLHYFGMTIGRDTKVLDDMLQMARDSDVDPNSLRVILLDPVTQAVEQRLLQGRSNIQDVFLAAEFVKNYQRAWRAGRQNLSESN